MKVVVSITALISLVLLFEGSLKWVDAGPLEENREPLEEKLNYGEPLEEKLNNGEVAVRSSKRERRQADGCDCYAYVYDGANYGGRSLLLRHQNANFLEDWFDNRVESAIIVGPCYWIFYQHFFTGRTSVMRPGSYPTAAYWGGPGNDISSARALPPPGTVAIALFEHSHYQGRMLVLYNSIRYLHYHDFEDHVSSIIVTGGSWNIYDQRQYTGAYSRLGRGDYPDVPHFGHDKISSIRKN